MIIKSCYAALELRGQVSVSKDRRFRRGESYTKKIPICVSSRIKRHRCLNTQLLAAEQWYGYGLWDAPYWFVGPEPGMARSEGDNLATRCNAWATLCKGRPLELVDCIEHHRQFRHVKFFTRSIRMKHPVLDEVMRPPTQATWRRLITLLLAYLGERTDVDIAAQYQCTEWGRLKGDTCVVELSAVAARNFATKRDRGAFRAQRVRTLRKRLVDNKPKFVLFYGSRCREDYERIAGGSFDRRGYRWSGNTLCVLVEHPAARPGKPTAWWIRKGRGMRKRVQDAGKKTCTR